jgi:hypothetical protein
VDDGVRFDRAAVGGADRHVLRDKPAEHSIAAAHASPGAEKAQNSFQNLAAFVGAPLVGALGRRQAPPLQSGF